MADKTKDEVLAKLKENMKAADNNHTLFDFGNLSEEYARQLDDIVAAADYLTDNDKAILKAEAKRIRETEGLLQYETTDKKDGSHLTATAQVVEAAGADGKIDDREQGLIAEKFFSVKTDGLSEAAASRVKSEVLKINRKAVFGEKDSVGLINLDDEKINFLRGKVAGDKIGDYEANQFATLRIFDEMSHGNNILTELQMQNWLKSNPDSSRMTYDYFMSLRQKNGDLPLRRADVSEQVEKILDRNLGGDDTKPKDGRISSNEAFVDPEKALSLMNEALKRECKDLNIKVVPNLRPEGNLNPDVRLQLEMVKEMFDLIKGPTMEDAKKAQELQKQFEQVEKARKTI